MTIPFKRQALIDPAAAFALNKHRLKVAEGTIQTKIRAAGYAC